MTYAASTASAVLAIPSAATALAGLPASLMASGVVVLAMIGLVHRVFPQASADRLSWWESGWARRRD